MTFNITIKEAKYLLDKNGYENLTTHRKEKLWWAKAKRKGFEYYVSVSGRTRMRAIGNLLTSVMDNH